MSKISSQPASQLAKIQKNTVMDVCIIEPEYLVTPASSYYARNKSYFAPYERIIESSSTSSSFVKMPSRSGIPFLRSASAIFTACGTSSP